MNSIIQQKEMLLKYICFLEQSISYLPFVTHNQKDDFINTSQYMLDFSKQKLQELETQIYQSCFHHFVEDYIDINVDQPLQRIHYCSICDLNYNDYLKKM